MEPKAIIQEINETLDHLVSSASAMHNISKSSLSKVEIESFQKNQENLLARLIFLDTQLDKEELKESAISLKIQEKLSQFESINNRFINIAAGASLGVVKFEKKKQTRANNSTIKPLA